MTSTALVDAPVWHKPAETKPGRASARPAATRANQTAPAFSAVIVRSAAALAEHLAALEDLGAAAFEPNVFFEPWMFLPAVEGFAANQALDYVLVYGRSPERTSMPPVLYGFFPLEKQQYWKGLPIRVVRIWRHVYSVLGTPLLRADGARECWEFFVKWLAATPNGATLLELAFVTGDGPFNQLLVDHANAHGTLSYVAESFNRALFRPRASVDDYLAAALSGKHRQEMRRMERRLAELGSLRYAVLEPDADPTPWIADFLQLEADGWKGREGTALGRQEGDCRFFKAFAHEAHWRGKLQMLGLFLNDKPIALKCNLLAGEGGYAFKIAYDEALARYSPGVLLELFTIRHLHGCSGPAWMDSCAIPDHPMINRLWLDRRTIQTVLISTGRCAGDFVVSLLPALRWVKRRVIGRTVLELPA